MIPRAPPTSTNQKSTRTLMSLPRRARASGKAKPLETTAGDICIDAPPCPFPCAGFQATTEGRAPCGSEEVNWGLSTCYGR